MVPASERFVAELHAFERLLSDAYAAGGRLAAAAIGAQCENHLSPTAGHQVLGAISAANLSISDALSRASQGHRLAEVLARHLGIDPTSYGDGLKPPAMTLNTAPIAASVDS